MQVFITGGSGWIGSAVVDELIAAGHKVTALARSDRSADQLAAAGAEVLRGDLDDLDALRRGAGAADATIHLANKHDWSDPVETGRAERAAVEAIVQELAASGRRFVLASALAGLAEGRPATEADPSPFVGPGSLRGGSENLALDFVERGVHTVVVRFPASVHGVGDPQFVAMLTAAARRAGEAVYVGDGAQGWAAVHRDDAARAVRLGLELAAPGARLHPVAEQAVPMIEIARALGARYDLPVASLSADQALERLGAVGRFVALDLAASSAGTRAALGWEPVGPTLLDDIAAGGYDHAGSEAASGVAR